MLVDIEQFGCNLGQVQHRIADMSSEAQESLNSVEQGASVRSQASSDAALKGVVILVSLGFPQLVLWQCQISGS